MNKQHDEMLGCQVLSLDGAVMTKPYTMCAASGHLFSSKITFTNLLWSSTKRWICISSTCQTASSVSKGAVLEKITVITFNIMALPLLCPGTDRSVPVNMQHVSNSPRQLCTDRTCLSVMSCWCTVLQWSEYFGYYYIFNVCGETAVTCCSLGCEIRNFVWVQIAFYLL